VLWIKTLNNHGKKRKFPIYLDLNIKIIFFIYF
jgi:hypothetical protein